MPSRRRSKSRKALAKRRSARDSSRRMQRCSYKATQRYRSASGNTGEYNNNEPPSDPPEVTAYLNEFLRNDTYSELKDKEELNTWIRNLENKKRIKRNLENLKRNLANSNNPGNRETPTPPPGTRNRAQKDQNEFP